MPHGKANRQIGGNNDDQRADGGGQHAPKPASDSESVVCCSPRSCHDQAARIDPAKPSDCVKVLCNNDECLQSGWMHKPCFDGEFTRWSRNRIT